MLSALGVADGSLELTILLTFSSSTFSSSCVLFSSLVCSDLLVSVVNSCFSSASAAASSSSLLLLFSILDLVGMSVLSGCSWAWRPSAQMFVWILFKGVWSLQINDEGDETYLQSKTP